MSTKLVNELAVGDKFKIGGGICTVLEVDSEVTVNGIECIPLRLECDDRWVGWNNLKAHASVVVL